MRSFQERKTKIKQMPTEELRRRYLEGRFGELRPFVEAELTERDLVEKSASDLRAEDREEKTLSIAFRSERWAMYAAIIATVALVIAIKDQILDLIFLLLNLKKWENI